MKTCKRCGESKPRSEFYPRPDSKDGYTNQCKDCRKQGSSRTAKKLELGNQGFKCCTQCDEVKPFTEFNKQAKAGFGFAAECRECFNSLRRDRTPSPKIVEKRSLGEQGLKRCSKCDVVKTLADFFNHPSSYLGVLSYCKECSKQPPERRRHYESIRRTRKLSGIVEGFTRKELLASYAERGYDGCVYCSGAYQHDDHFIALSKGGKHSLDNLVPACASCNSSKHASDPYEWMERKGFQFTL